MTYKETLDYLFSALPMYQRVGAAAFKKDLTNTLALCDAIGNPHLKIKTVHVAGTNGKGSSSHFLAAILQASGYKVGVYTSPHYRDFRERIKINGVYIPENAVISFVENNKTNFERIEPSFFEMTVALAFDYFYKENVDIAIIETGLGGRLDSTNIITPLLSLITNISLDHQDMLGDTLALIAAEKAGIIKKGVPVLISEMQAETAPVFLAKASEMQSEIQFADALLATKIHAVDTKIRLSVTRKNFENSANQNDNQNDLQRFSLDAIGEYQTKNLLGVLLAADILKQYFENITPETIKKGLTSVKKLTNMIGRWQILGESPMIIADSGHNEGGLRETMPQLAAMMEKKRAAHLMVAKRQAHQRIATGFMPVKNIHLHFVLGVVRDKEISKMLACLPRNARYYFAKADIPRGMPADELQTKAADYMLLGNAYESIASAFAAAKSSAQSEDVIFVGGSCFTVAEVL